MMSHTSGGRHGSVGGAGNKQVLAVVKPVTCRSCLASSVSGGWWLLSSLGGFRDGRSQALELHRCRPVGSALYAEDTLRALVRLEIEMTEFDELSNLRAENGS